MRQLVLLAVGSVCIAMPVSVASAEFAAGNLSYIQGVAGPENGYSYWGSNVSGLYHPLGTSGQSFTETYSTAGVVLVTSWVNSPTSVTFLFDFSGFNPGQYSVHAIEIIGLKEDGSLSSVTASQGSAYVQGGIKIRWDGLGADLAQQPQLMLTIEQVPAPGAMAVLFGSALVAGARRRRDARGH